MEAEMNKQNGGRGKVRMSGRCNIKNGGKEDIYSLREEYSV